MSVRVPWYHEETTRKAGCCGRRQRADDWSCVWVLQVAYWSARRVRQRCPRGTRPWAASTAAMPRMAWWPTWRPWAHWAPWRAPAGAWPPSGPWPPILQTGTLISSPPVSCELRPGTCTYLQVRYTSVLVLTDFCLGECQQSVPSIKNRAKKCTLQKSVKWKGMLDKAINCYSSTSQLIVFSDVLFHLIGFRNTSFHLISSFL